MNFHFFFKKSKTKKQQKMEIDSSNANNKDNTNKRKRDEQKDDDNEKEKDQNQQRQQDQDDNFPPPAKKQKIDKVETPISVFGHEEKAYLTNSLIMLKSKEIKVNLNTKENKVEQKPKICMCDKAKEIDFSSMFFFSFFFPCKNSIFFCFFSLVAECFLVEKPSNIDSKTSDKKSCDCCALCKQSLEGSCCQCIDTADMMDESEKKQCGIACKNAAIFDCLHQFHAHCLITNKLNICPVCQSKRKINPNLINKFVIVNIDGQSKEYDLEKFNKELTCNVLYNDLKIDPCQYALMYPRTLCYCDPKRQMDIAQGTVLSVCDCSLHPIVIKVDLIYQNEKTTIEMTTENTLYDFKMKVQQKTGVAADLQQLEFASLNLDSSQDNFFLFQLGLKANNSVVQLTKLDSSQLVQFIDLYSNGQRICTEETLQKIVDSKHVIIGFLRRDNKRGNVASGPQDFFSNCAAWNPTVCEQTNLGMSIFLSSLFVVYKQLALSFEKKEKFLKILQTFMDNEEDGLLPSILAWKILLEGKIFQFQNTHRVLISNFMLKILCKFSAIDFTFVSTGFAVSSSSSIPINCSQLFEKSYIVLAYILAHLLEADKLKNLVQFDTVSLQKSAAEWKEEYLSLADTDEIYVFKENKEKDAMTDVKELKTKSKEKTNVFEIPKWTYILRDYKLFDFLHIVDTNGLAKCKTFALAIDDSGSICVYVGKTKSCESEITLFSPLKGTETDYKKTSLIEKISKLPQEIIALQTNKITFDDFKQDFGVMVCLDVSSSMGEDAKFQDDDKNKKKQEKKENDSDDDDDDDKVKWDVEEQKFPLFSLQDMTENSKRVQLDKAMVKFMNHPNFVDLLFMVQRLSGEGYVYNKKLITLTILFHFCSFEQSNDKSLVKMIKTYRSAFADVLMGRNYVDILGRTTQKPTSCFPGSTSEMICPLSGQIMTDPVKHNDSTVDPFTYEKTALTKWISNYNCSPYSGIFTGSYNYNANIILKKKIQALQAQKAKEETAAKEAKKEKEKEKKQEKKDTDKNISSSFSFVASSSSSSSSKRELVPLTVELISSSMQYEVECCLQDNVQELKQKIEQASGISAKSQVLICNSVNVQDDTNPVSKYVQSTSSPSLYKIYLMEKTNLAEKKEEQLPRLNSSNKSVTLDIDFTNLSKYKRIQQKKISLYEKDQIHNVGIRVWCLFAKNPKELSLHNTKLTYGSKETGDGHETVYWCRDDHSVKSHLTKGDGLDDTPFKVYLLDYNAKKYQERTERLNRGKTCVQLFHAFVNRIEAYEFNAAIGLLTFGTKVDILCEMTSDYDKFRDHLNDVEFEGETTLFDAINQASNTLLTWKEKVESKNNQKLKQPLRIIVLTDGKDTKSKYEAHEIATKLQTNNILLDTIMIGQEKDKHLPALAKLTNGYCFQPTSLENALKICELEVFLNDDVRPRLPSRPLIRSSFQFDAFTNNLDRNNQFLDVCDREHYPLHKNQITKEEYRHMVTSIEQFSKQMLQVSEQPNSFSSVYSPETIKRVKHELNSVLKNPHPSMKVYIYNNNLCEWRILLKGPDQTIYAGGVWLLSCSFSPKYPSVAPVVSFVTTRTPILHCNINEYGRVCHSVFQRYYLPETPVSTLFACVYGLLLTPDMEDPLNTALLVKFHQGGYEVEIMEHTKKHASRSMLDWQKEFDAI
jgi:ubiquitin-protein ligase